MAPTNKKKRKNANYTSAARSDAREQHKLATSNMATASTRLFRHGTEKQGWFYRFIMGKNDIFAQNPNKKSFNYCILGFLIPFVFAGLAMLMRAIMVESDGSSIFSLLYSDAYYQYFPFFVDFRNSIRAGESFLYTWNIGMGTDYLGLYAYYVASPLNLLTAFVPEAWVLDFYSFLFPVRIGLAGLFFSIFLKKTFDRNDLSIAIFASFYATCAWVFGYMWNVMWLDTFAVMPLAILGTISLLKERKFVLYTLSLFYCIFANYYVGFFVCIFILLVFICYEICRWTTFKRFAVDLGHMAFFTILAIGMTAILSLPTFAALQTTNSAASEFPKAFDMHIADEKSFAGLVEAMVKVATNTYAAIEPNYVDAASSGGLPNIYCGLFATVLSLLFFTCKEIKWRDRICALVMLLFLNLSFILKQLDYIWHGFHFTNMIPNRFSFIYSFVMLYMAYRTWLLRRKIRTWQIVSVGFVALLGMFFSPGFKEFMAQTNSESVQAGMQELSQNFSFGKLYDIFTVEMLFPLVNGLLLLGYLIALFCLAIRHPLPRSVPRKTKLLWYRDRRFRRNLCSLILVAIICVEFIFHVTSFGLQFNTQNASGYPRGGEDAKKVIQYMKDKEGENSFYRADAAQVQTYNDGALNNYNGISTFSSSANVNVTNFLQALGVSGYKTYNRFAYADGSPITNLFLNLKYVIERRGFVEDNHSLTDVYSSGKVHLMENNYYLPVGFMVDPKLSELQFADNGGNFYFQNLVLSAALGREVTPWTIVSNENLTISGTENVKFDPPVKANENTACYTKDSKGDITFLYSFDDSGLFCVRYHMPSKNDYKVYYKAAGTSSFVKLHDEKHNSLGYIASVCEVKPGDQVKIVTTCKASTTTNQKVSITGAILNQSVMEDAYAQLSQSTLQVTKFEDTRIEGTINCLQDGLMYTSVPQSGNNWHVLVDGKEAQITLVGETMIGVMLTKGTHNIVIQFENNAFVIGAVVTISCAVIFTGLCIYTYGFRKRRKKEATQQTENPSEEG